MSDVKLDTKSEAKSDTSRVGGMPLYSWIAILAVIAVLAVIFTR